MYYTDCIFTDCFGQAAWEALGNVIGTVHKETLPSLLKGARDAVSTARDKERRKRKVTISHCIHDCNMMTTDSSLLSAVAFYLKIIRY